MDKESGESGYSSERGARKWGIWSYSRMGEFENTCEVSYGKLSGNAMFFCDPCFTEGDSENLVAIVGIFSVLEKKNFSEFLHISSDPFLSYFSGISKPQYRRLIEEFNWDIYSLLGSASSVDGRKSICSQAGKAYFREYDTQEWFKRVSLAKWEE